MKKWLLLLLLLFFWLSVSATAASGTDSPVSGAMAIERIRGPVTLDGRSDEPAWRGIAPLPFVMHDPVFRRDPSEQTEVLLAYDDRFLYIAGRLYDREPDKIQIHSNVRDSGDASSDWFGVVLDTYNDKENALAFFTTPSGLRWDAEVLNDAKGSEPINTTWNTFWDVVAKKSQEGWFVEMRIPFTSLRFQKIADRVTMGLICWRKISRLNEWDIFPAIPPTWGYWSKFKPSQAKEIVVQGIQAQRSVYIAPYVLGGYEEAHMRDAAGMRDQTIRIAEKELGLDVKYGLTSNLIMDLTVNPDFAQVEADDQQVNLTRYSLFFPEKRLFFQERSGIFDFNMGGTNNLFYSRRIGLEDGRRVRILGGGRIVGRLGAWDLGFLDLQTAADSESEGENFGVLRLRHQAFNDNSFLGAILTSRLSRNGQYNLAYGLDSAIRLFGNDYLTGRWVQTFQKGKTNDPLSLAPTRIFLNWQRQNYRGLGYWARYQRAGRDYEPGMGFELRQDFTSFEAGAWYGAAFNEHSPLLSINPYLNGYVYQRNADRRTDSAIVEPGFWADTKSGYMLDLYAQARYENVPQEIILSPQASIPPGEYHFFNLIASGKMPGGRPLQATVSTTMGTYFNGSRMSLNFSPTWHVSAGLELSGSYEFNSVNFSSRDQRWTSHIGRLRALLMLNTTWSASAYLQYSSGSRALCGNLRLRFNPREGSDLYLVYNETFAVGRNPGITDSSLVGGRTLLLKFTHTIAL